MLLPYYYKGCIEVGCDEAGRGSLVGRVYAAAVVWQEDETFTAKEFNYVMDSKRLSPNERFKMRQFILQRARTYAVAYSSADEIATMNILHASLLAMRRAIKALTIVPQHILVDGNKWEDYYVDDTHVIPFHTIVHGDNTYLSIAAASILAKTSRDEWMEQISTEYPMYRWDKNKGYGTQEHYDAIEKYGVSPYHRTHFLLNKRK